VVLFRDLVSFAKQMIVKDAARQVVVGRILSLDISSYPILLSFDGQLSINDDVDDAYVCLQ
jgi:hypothetical protein